MDQFGQYLGLGVVAGGIAAVWAYFKSFWHWLSGFVIVRIHVDIGLSEAIAQYFWKQAKRSPFADRYYLSLFRFVRPLQRFQLVVAETLEKGAKMIWLGWCPIMMQEIRSGPQPGQSGDRVGTQLSYIRGTLNADDFLIAVTGDPTDFASIGNTRRYRIERQHATIPHRAAQRTSDGESERKRPRRSVAGRRPDGEKRMVDRPGM